MYIACLVYYINNSVYILYLYLCDVTTTRCPQHFKNSIFKYDRDVLNLNKKKYLKLEVVKRQALEVQRNNNAHSLTIDAVEKQ